MSSIGYAFTKLFQHLYENDQTCNGGDVNLLFNDYRFWKAHEDIHTLPASLVGATPHLTHVGYCDDITHERAIVGNMKNDTILQHQ